MRLTVVLVQRGDVMCRVGAGPEMRVFTPPQLPAGHDFRPGDWLELDGEGDEGRLYKVGQEPEGPKTVVLSSE